jgi:hypothetical protein
MLIMTFAVFTQILSMAKSDWSNWLDLAVACFATGISLSSGYFLRSAQMQSPHGDLREISMTGYGLFLSQQLLQVWPRPFGILGCTTRIPSSGQFSCDCNNFCWHSCWWGVGKDKNQSSAGETEQNDSNHAVAVCFQLCLNRRVGKAAHRERHHHAAGISCEDFRRADDVSGHVQADPLDVDGPSS